MRFRRFRTYRTNRADSIARGYGSTEEVREDNVRGMGNDNGDRRVSCRSGDVISDRGNAPYAFNIVEAAEKNTDFRRVIWTGKHFQIVLMSIPQGGEIPFEIHEGSDQLIVITSGQGEVMMGRLAGDLNYKMPLGTDSAVIVPSGTYHVIRNVGRAPMKLYTVYAPKLHPFGEVIVKNEE